MPAHCTFPTLLDEVKQISITKLKKFGFFELNSYKSGQLTWSRRDKQIGSINISVDLRESPQCFLWYTYNKEESVNYKVKLDSIPSNLGVGKIWYFLCPHTNKRCRILYGAGKYFLHREAYPDAMYEKQTYSKKMRELDRYFSFYYSLDDLYSELYSKHFKTHYDGKPTKRYKQIMNKLREIKDKEVYYLKMFERLAVK